MIHTLADDFASEVAKLCATSVSDRQWSQFLNAHVTALDHKTGLPLTGRSLTTAQTKRTVLDRLYRYDQRVAPGQAPRTESCRPSIPTSITRSQFEVAGGVSGTCSRRWSGVSACWTADRGGQSSPACCRKPSRWDGIRGRPTVQLRFRLTLDN
jgi:hypothetical protein